MKNLQKIISALLLTALIISCLPVLPLKASAATVASGSCGDNLTWVLDDSGNLFVSGKGAMTNYSSSSHAPWYIYRQQIQSVVIGEGITRIGSYAFRQCENITQVSIATTVTTIDSYAFSGCTSLTSMVLPDRVTVLGESAFSGCTGLTSMVLPNSVTWLGESAFSGCTGLTGIALGNGVTSIGDQAFSGCTGLTIVTIPDNVETIGTFVFQNCTGITDIVIGSGVQSIGDWAFSGCSALTGIRVSEGNSYYSCDEFGVLFNQAKTVLIAAPGAITGAYTIPSTVKTITHFAFDNCTGLTNITIGQNVTKLSANAFIGCTGLTEIYIPTKVAALDSSVFSQCTGLKKIIVAKDNATYSSDDKGVLFNKDQTELIKAPSALAGEYEIPGGVKTIQKYAFNTCPDLTSITIPSSVSSIGTYAFNGCKKLYGFRVAEDNGYYSSDAQGVLFNKSKTRLIKAPGALAGTYTVADSVTTLDGYAFADCSGLCKLYFNATAPSIGTSCFENLSLTAYYHPGSTWTSSVMKNYGGSVTWQEITDQGQDVTINCIAFGNAGDSITVLFYPDGASDAAYSLTGTITGNSGSWTVEGVAAGSYTVSVSKKNHTAREYALTVKQTDIALDVKICLLGDVTGDGLVNFSDYSKVLSQSKNPASQVLSDYAFLCGDVTADGIINFSDYSKVLSQAKGNHTLW